MKKNRSVVTPLLYTLCVAPFSLFPPVARAETPPPPLAAAVLDFQAGDDLAGKGAAAAGLLNAQLTTIAPDVILVERQEIEKVLGEQEFGMSGTVSPETAAKVGSLTGAKVLITGRLFNAGDKVYVVAKIISTETGRVYGESATCPDPSTLDKAVAELAPKIAADLKTHADTLVARVEDPAARLERLKKLVAGHTPLPSVSVVITEQHLNAVVIDPAAQTDMKLTLEQLGFDVVEPEATQRQADVQIGGEAFSEFAGRHGSLISCRARVEIRMIQPGTGKLLLADRDTAMAVDVAENVAGKTAIENAADRLLERILPKLVAP
jgi:TolB-like protein